MDTTDRLLDKIVDLEHVSQDKLKEEISSIIRSIKSYKNNLDQETEILESAVNIFTAKYPRLELKLYDFIMHNNVLVNRKTKESKNASELVEFFSQNLT